MVFHAFPSMINSMKFLQVTTSVRICNRINCSVYKSAFLLLFWQLSHLVFSPTNNVVFCSCLSNFQCRVNHLRADKSPCLKSFQSSQKLFIKCQTVYHATNLKIKTVFIISVNLFKTEQLTLHFLVSNKILSHWPIDKKANLRRRERYGHCPC